MNTMKNKGKNPPTSDGEIFMLQGVVRTVSDKDANKELFGSKPGTIVHHTTNRELIIHISWDPMMKVKRVLISHDGQ